MIQGMAGLIGSERSRFAPVLSLAALGPAQAQTVTIIPAQKPYTARRNSADRRVPAILIDSQGRRFPETGHRSATPIFPYRQPQGRPE